MTFFETKKCHGEPGHITAGKVKNINGVGIVSATGKSSAASDAEILHYVGNHFPKQDSPLPSFPVPARGILYRLFPRDKRTWEGVKARCRNADNGVELHPEWKLFWNFLRDTGLKPEGDDPKTRWTVHRPTTDEFPGGIPIYGPGCYYLPMSVNNKKKGNAKLITCDGKTLSAAEWSIESGIPSPTIRYRVNKLKWPPKRAIWEPVGASKGKAKLPDTALVPVTQSPDSPPADPPTEQEFEYKGMPCLFEGRAIYFDLPEPDPYVIANPESIVNFYYRELDSEGFRCHPEPYRDMARVRQSAKALENEGIPSEPVLVYVLSRWLDFEEFCREGFSRRPGVHPCLKYVRSNLDMVSNFFFHHNGTADLFEEHPEEFRQAFTHLQVEWSRLEYPHGLYLAMSQSLIFLSLLLGREDDEPLADYLRLHCRGLIGWEKLGKYLDANLIWELPADPHCAVPCTPEEMAEWENQL
jgi:hypothetical protein